MIDVDAPEPMRDAAIAADLEANLAPMLADLSAGFADLAGRRLAEEGWQPVLASAAVTLALPVFIDAMLDDIEAGEAIDRAIDHGRRALFAAIYRLGEGEDPRRAFLMLVALERGNAERAGAPVTNYPAAWIGLAVAAVEAAARRGEPSGDQVAAGFSALAEAGRAAVRSLGQ